MDAFSIVSISAFVTVAVFLVGLLISYMASLIRSAYQIKVELRNDVDCALGEMHVQMEQRTKAMRREVGEESGKVRAALEARTQETLAEIRQDLDAFLRESQDESHRDVKELRSQVAFLKERVERLEGSLGVTGGLTGGGAGGASTGRAKTGASVGVARAG